MKRLFGRGSFIYLHRIWAAAVLATSVVLCVAVVPAGSIPSVSKGTVGTGALAHESTSVTVPVGAPDASEPSGQSPPGPHAMPGYRESYVTDFNGSTVPAGWDVYTGEPGGDPGAQWGASHVVVSGGMLQLSTWQDPAYGGEWVAGGLCQCGISANTYGAYFVRSRMTGPGPTQVELLWPTSGWPPEIDFDETFGGDTFSMVTLHWSSTNQQIHNSVNANMEQWHTWGVIWTPTSVTYTLDGQVWSQVDVAADVPHQPMTLDIQQQTWCDVAPNSNSPSTCPTTPQSTQVDWVAEYTPTSSSSTTATALPTTNAFTVGPFSTNSWSLTTRLRAQIDALATNIADTRDMKIVLTGYGDTSSTRAKSLVISRDRALSVDRFLKKRLVDLNVASVQIVAAWKGGSKTSTSSASINTPVVLARIS
jgi:outer membrane protein OmpA-like peptidoglycan-associated protein